MKTPSVPQSLVALLLIFPCRIVNGQGIKPLDATTFEEAKSRGASMKEGEAANSPLTIAMRAKCLRAIGSLDCRVAIKRGEDAPFFPTIQTPFMVTAGLAEEAKRKFTEPKFPALEELNAMQVRVMVGPGSSMLTVDAIENVVIKRGDTVIRPIKSDVTPTVVQNRLGAKKDTAEGSFMFPFEAFDPTTPVTLVLIGKGGNFELAMSTDELAQMR